MFSPYQLLTVALWASMVYGLPSGPQGGTDPPSDQQPDTLRTPRRPPITYEPPESGNDPRVQHMIHNVGDVMSKLQKYPGTPNDLWDAFVMCMKGKLGSEFSVDDYVFEELTDQEMEEARKKEDECVDSFEGGADKVIADAQAQIQNRAATTNNNEEGETTGEGSNAFVANGVDTAGMIGTGVVGAGIVGAGALLSKSGGGLQGQMQ